MGQDTDNLPLVSCIMPTFNRRAFVPQAIAYFLRQDYSNRELIIIDDGSDPVDDLIPEDARICYTRLNAKAALGAKRNRACEQARGDIIAHWDDDDWQAPRRLSYQVEALLREGTDVCGIHNLLFYDMDAECAWRYVYPEHQRAWLSGSTLCYRRAFWDSNRFAAINVGEDARFVWNGRKERMTVLSDSTFHVGIIHRQNVSPKQTHGAYWHPYPDEEIRQLLGADWAYYQPHQPIATGTANTRPVSLALPTGERNTGMIAVAQEADLALPEFAAFNAGQSLPRMRRWELPFALFQARLANTIALLDCAINPASFQERLQCLYPHTLYRHWSPIQNGRFALPFGVPDASFDRVVCVNTLEHLLKEQRDALVAAMARKLKPGGLLILTSDYYFDSSWERPVFLRAGVMRADRQEIFNGWNKVTPQEWLSLCQKHDLHPMSEDETIVEPQENDSTLYLNQQPYTHACVGGVFYKSPRMEMPAGKKVVLALLTWNTRDISIESLEAYIREAHMLKRLGQEPIICVCDNGSSDGTADALRQLEEQLDIPHKFILNRENFGNSIARNQIIDYARQCAADYVLFMDGDIEIVPFSSFAMLRYMENSGSRLGCIGADSSGQTPHRQLASPYHYSINGCKLETTNLVAWTQYGMFRRAVFDDGCRFDEREPFHGPGWGFEDNDLAFQMDVKGYLNQRFFGMVYLHRAARSSIRIMRERGIDPAALYDRRKQYVIDKWASVPEINNGPLKDVRRVVMNV
ncbi:MAG: glycosyltransferase [Ktedonobacteraceae bacterium]